MILLLGSLTVLSAAELAMRPNTQWTFDTAVEQVVFLESAAGYPIYMIRTENYITLFDSTGEEFRTIPRIEHDDFVLSDNRSGFMLVHDQQLAESDRQEHLFSFQVYNSTGAPEYTSVHTVDYTSGKLQYQLTGKRSIILTEQGKPWLLELSGDDTLLYINSVQTTNHQTECTPHILAKKLKLPHEMVIASSCRLLDSTDTPEVELRIWDHDTGQTSSVRVNGELMGIQGVPGSDYYFLELDHGAESSLTLFNRTNAISTFPWKSWEVRPLGQEAAFIISETDLNVVNLGDGALAATYHPIELRGISDAAYMPEWGIFLYLRYRLYFTKEGKQAFRNFVLEGVDQSGQLVHRSSFGTWSTILPRITRVGDDQFSIHIHNAVLLYDIGSQ